jgi:hypothetical protein
MYTAKAAKMRYDIPVAIRYFLRTRCGVFKRRPFGSQPVAHTFVCHMIGKTECAFEFSARSVGVLACLSQ